MTLTADYSRTGAATAGLLACLDELAETGVEALGATEQGAWLRDLARAEAKIAAIRSRVLAVAEAAQTFLDAGSASTGQWVAAVTNSDQTTTHRQVGLANGLIGRAATAQALAAGQLSAAHAAVIVRVDRDLPPELGETERDRVEAKLIQQATRHSPSALRRIARRALAEVEPDEAVVDAHEDGLVAGEEAAARARVRLSLHDNQDGTVTGHFTVPTFEGHVLRKVLEAMTAPRRARLGASADAAGDNTGLRKDWDRARGEAFCELIAHLPTDHLHPRTAATIIVTIDETSLRGRLKSAGLDTGERLSAGEARRLACTAGILPAVLNGRSRPVDLGRSQRLFDEAQRLAIGLVHGSCVAWGCERPFAWCELHHRRPWSKGGRTDLKDGVPLCHFHHRRIHDNDYTHDWLPDGTVRFRRRSSAFLRQVSPVKAPMDSRSPERRVSWR